MPSALIKQFTACVVISAVGLSSPAQAGPLIDWLFGRYRAAPAYPVGPPVAVGGATAAGYANYGPGYAANYGNYYGSQLPVIGPAGAGYSALRPTGVTAATLPSTLSYVPNYRTNAYRAPVTYYRPLMTTDPNTGAQVVAMAPCTSYEYQTQRVPTWGRSALFGSSNLPSIVPAAPAQPTYTLPRGGIPLAQSGPALSPYRSGYPGYATLMPSPGLTGRPGAYPTVPLGSTSYYGGTFSGGSCGQLPPSAAIAPGYASPPPGLNAPPAPSLNPAPGTTITPAPTYGQPTSPPAGYDGSVLPGTGMPGTGVPGAGIPGTGAPSPVYPSPGAPSADPRASQPPSLPSVGTPPGISSNRPPRSQLRSVVRQPMSAGTQAPPANSRNSSSSPALSPIPVPEGFRPSPRWNPGLLKEEDLTALRPIAPEVAQYAGQSKRIHWASFEQPVASQPPIGSGNRLRSIAPAQQPELQPRQPASQANRRSQDPAYDSRGWKASR